MAIDELTRIVPPPEHPFHAEPPVKWNGIEEAQQLALPSDWLRYAATYGSGYFLDSAYFDESEDDLEDSCPSISIFNPFSPHFQARIEGLRFELLEAVRSTGGEAVPHPIFPEKEGLFPFGQEDGNDVLLCWLTVGEPDHWPIILRSGWRQDDHFEVRLPLTEFLVKLLTCEVEFPCWPGSWPVNRIRFEPLEM
jgi:hypothetical protein